MRRLQLLEIEDQPWCPASLRDTVTDYLQILIDRTNAYGPAAELLADALRRSGERRIVDLCSGAGGPWRRLRDAIVERLGGERVRLHLTDRYPNRAALTHLAASPDDVVARLEPVDATSVPADLHGFRTLFSSFHHFPPPLARRILEDAARGPGILIAEAVRRQPSTMLLMLALPIAALAIAPAIRPWRWSRLVWTYLVPAGPLVLLLDGLVSCLRAYSPDELLALAATAGGDGFNWHAGEVKAGRLVRMTYLLGSRVEAPGRSGIEARPSSRF